VKRHPADLLSLAAGIVFVLIGVAALNRVLDLRLITGDWLWPAVLIGAGLAVLLTIGDRRESDAAAIEARADDRVESDER
jgi:hypothetical protein